MGEIERHRQLAQCWQPGPRPGGQLSRHTVHPDDEHPLSEPSDKDFIPNHLFCIIKPQET